MGTRVNQSPPELNCLDGVVGAGDDNGAPRKHKSGEIRVDIWQHWDAGQTSQEMPYSVQFRLVLDYAL